MYSFSEGKKINLKECTKPLPEDANYDLENNDSRNVLTQCHLELCYFAIKCILILFQRIRVTFLIPRAGADPGFFLGGGAPLRNDITDGEVKKKKIKYVYTKKKASSQGGGAHPLHPPPRSAPARVTQK